ncbi:hypothetical protein SELSPUOL_01040 [Selenomonas sputigena ATCC 35185]|uniref:Uncharacterized protein n=1 Tax=Selenomonas sputigena (strain ATCC 35185 / DSM 20758 / CCUG 44933 / VPI D19B-28) TaxID=546271 RepID=C9LTM9_SELS3|nr:hypothetical protein SELSPUOL_01040 [Selenomonas sputigena ATCC 35185]
MSCSCREEDGIMKEMNASIEVPHGAGAWQDAQLALSRQRET